MPPTVAPTAAPSMRRRRRRQIISKVRLAAPPYLRPTSATQNPLVHTYQDLLGVAKASGNTTAIQIYTKKLAKAQAVANALDAPSSSSHARNFQPSTEACFAQCRQIIGCEFGTYEQQGGDTPGECWLSKFTTGADSGQPCEHCVSFRVS